MFLTRAMMLKIARAEDIDMCARIEAGGCRAGKRCVPKSWLRDATAREVATHHIDDPGAVL